MRQKIWGWERVAFLVAQPRELLVALLDKQPPASRTQAAARSFGSVWEHSPRVTGAATTDTNVALCGGGNLPEQRRWERAGTAGSRCACSRHPCCSPRALSAELACQLACLC